MEKDEHLDQGDFWRECLGCGGRRFKSPQFPFCRDCYKIYKDRLKEPWVRSLQNYNTVSHRSWVKQRMQVLSIDQMEEAMEEELSE